MIGDEKNVEIILESEKFYNFKRLVIRLQKRLIILVSGCLRLFNYTFLRRNKRKFCVKYDIWIVQNDIDLVIMWQMLRYK